MTKFPTTSTSTQTFEQAWQALAKSRFLPLALLGLGTLSNVVYAHSPLLAFAVISGLTLTRRRAIAVAMGLWLISQAIGFGLRSYPFTPTALMWGVLMGAGTGLVVVLASWRPQLSRTSWLGHWLWSAIALLAGFCLYQGSILVAFPLLADGHRMDWVIVMQVLSKELVWASAIASVHSFLLWRWLNALHPARS